jgi:hypothetical protein
MSNESFYIGYAPVNCTTEKIQQDFDIYLKESIVSKVDERLKYNMKGKQYKIFFVHFKYVSPALEKLFKRVSTYQEATVKGWKIKFNTTLRDTHIEYIEKEDKLLLLANEIQPFKI